MLCAMCLPCSASVSRPCSRSSRPPPMRPRLAARGAGADTTALRPAVCPEREQCRPRRACRPRLPASSRSAWRSSPAARRARPIAPVSEAARTAPPPRLGRDRALRRGARPRRRPTPSGSRPAPPRSPPAPRRCAPAPPRSSAPVVDPTDRPRLEAAGAAERNESADAALFGRISAAPPPSGRRPHREGDQLMNSIIYLVGLIVIVLARPVARRPRLRPRCQERCRDPPRRRRLRADAVARAARRWRLRRLAGDLRRHRARGGAVLRAPDLRLGDRPVGRLVRARRGRVAASGSRIASGSGSSGSRSPASPPAATSPAGCAARCRAPASTRSRSATARTASLVWATGALVGAVLATSGVTGVVGAAGSRRRHRGADRGRGRRRRRRLSRRAPARAATPATPAPRQDGRGDHPQPRRRRARPPRTATISPRSSPSAPARRRRRPAPRSTPPSPRRSELYDAGARAGRAGPRRRRHRRLRRSPRR